MSPHPPFLSSAQCIRHYQVGKYVPSKKTECVQVNNHSFTYQFAFLDPVTLPPGQHVTFTAPNCVQLGRAVVAECPAHGGQLSLVPPGDDATANVTIRAQPWSGPACTGNGHGREAAARKTSRHGTAAAAAARRIRSAVPVPGIEYDGCYNGTNALQNITWAMIDDTRVDILASLETVCANGHLGYRTYGANDPGVCLLFLFLFFLSCPPPPFPPSISDPEKDGASTKFTFQRGSAGPPLLREPITKSASEKYYLPHTGQAVYQDSPGWLHPHDPGPCPVVERHHGC